MRGVDVDAEKKYLYVCTRKSVINAKTLVLCRILLDGWKSDELLMIDSGRRSGRSSDLA